MNQKLLAKLAARGETMEEREERRAQRRAARITAQFGYTAQENPFNDPNIADTFTWKKKDEALSASGGGGKLSRKGQQDKTIDEIEKVRKRRRDYEEQKEEMERIRAEESRMKELENYDDWAQKEELFHLQQQKQRSAIRLVEGREKPIDVLAKNLLLFGFTEQEKQNRAAVKYKERYNALEELENLEAELEEPHAFLHDLKLSELQELLVDIQAFLTLERDVGTLEVDADTSESNNTVLKYWTALHLVTKAEIEFIKSGGDKSRNSEATKAMVKKEIQTMLENQTIAALHKMKLDIDQKLIKGDRNRDQPVFDDDGSGVIDLPYWKAVLYELEVYLAKMELSDIHSKMLVCQLERLEKKKEELGKVKQEEENEPKSELKEESNAEVNAVVPSGVDPDIGNLEEELGLANEVDVASNVYTWQERYRPRKPRYFNRVKTGYDWNKYNQTHYDHDNPPPKIVQGYKFNIFYPDLIDSTKAPEYILEPAQTDDFCILRFRAGPPYEDIAFKIINRQWNKSRKRGFKCTFERGVLSLYFNFQTHWYRR